MFSVLNRSIALSLRIDFQLQLFKTLVEPVLIHGCEVWSYEDIGLLSRNEMRGVRMLLEITKPDLILEENKILSTIIIFGGAY